MKTLVLCSLLLYLTGFIMWVVGCYIKWRGGGRGLASSPSKFDTFSLVAIIASLVLHTVVIGIRTYYSSRLPVAAMGETLLFYSWCVMVATLFVVLRYRERTTGLVTIPIGIIALAVCLSKWTPPKTLPLILRTFWFEIHVIASFAAYALFSLAFAGALLYIIRTFGSSVAGGNSGESNAEPSLEIARTGVVWGFFLFSASMFSGAVWGYLAWGTYWMWEPKILWSFIVWFWFAGTMHAWYIKSLKGRTLAILTVLGFIVVGFTYLGVGLLMKNSHSF
jgi:ABC-type transport system involved in cytochrome c biogenesis permease subunit